ncbi:unnamed protein product [Closterium sp. NIES-53]
MHLPFRQGKPPSVTLIAQLSFTDSHLLHHSPSPAAHRHVLALTPSHRSPHSHAHSYPLSDSQPVQQNDWELCVVEIAADIISEQSPRR